MPVSLEEILEFRNDRFLDLERFGNITRQFLAWKFLDSVPPTAISILQQSDTRVKSDKSIADNFKSGEYDSVGDTTCLTDLVGARIVVYFLDHLSQFCTRENIALLFGTKAAATLEKYQADGYASYHFLLAVEQPSIFFSSLRPDDRIRFQGLVCEVQARTILQHAFAENNHQLNYKYKRLTGNDLPVDAKCDWLDAAKLVDQADQAVLTLKQQFENAVEFRTPATMTRKVTFQYRGDASYRNHGCFDYSGVVYGYTLDIPEGTASPRILVRDDVFEIDERMRAVCGVERYKQQVWETLERLRPESIRRVTHDSMTVRVYDYDPSDNVLTLQRAMYSDQVVSNHKFALDLEIPSTSHTVLQANLYPDGKFKSFLDSPFANTIGVCCIVRTKDDLWILSHHGTNKAYEPGLLGCSSAGALEWDELGSWGRERDFSSWFKHGMFREFIEELGVDMEFQTSVETLDEYIQFVGFGREVDRGGKPQAFFFVDERTKDFSDIREMWRIYADSVLSKPGATPEFKDIVGVPTDELRSMISDDPDLVIAAVRRTGAGSGIAEELRANAALAFRHLGI